MSGKVTKADFYKSEAKERGDLIYCEFFMIPLQFDGTGTSQSRFMEFCSVFLPWKKKVSPTSKHTSHLI